MVENLGKVNILFYFCIFIFSARSLSIYWGSGGEESGVNSMYFSCIYF